MGSEGNVSRLGQYMTPDWAALALVDQYLPGLSAADRVVEPTCGRGAFLRAIPGHVEAVGVEHVGRLDMSRMLQKIRTGDRTQ